MKTCAQVKHFCLRRINILPINKILPETYKIVPNLVSIQNAHSQAGEQLKVTHCNCAIIIFSFGKKVICQSALMRFAYSNNNSNNNKQMYMNYRGRVKAGGSPQINSLPLHFHDSDVFRIEKLHDSIEGR